MQVPQEWEDLNGHVNVKHHLGMYDLTKEAMLEMLGISEEWVRTGRTGIFDLEHHIWYSTRCTWARRSRSSSASRNATKRVQGSCSC